MLSGSLTVTPVESAIGTSPAANSAVGATFSTSGSSLALLMLTVMLPVAGAALPLSKMKPIVTDAGGVSLLLA